MIDKVFQIPAVQVFTAVFLLELAFLLYTAAIPAKGKIKFLMIAEVISFLAAICMCCYYGKKPPLSHVLENYVFLFISLFYGAFVILSAAICGTRYASCNPKQPDKKDSGTNG